uniref:C2 domain-containing protein n=1 Tax=Lotharella globosa TaxID=91324 RepID=A0A7S3YSM1_9EUKA
MMNRRQFRNADSYWNPYWIGESMLHIRIEEARGLAQADATGYSDPYVKFYVGKTKYRTKNIDNTLRPIWNEDFACKNIKGDEVLKFVVNDNDTMMSAQDLLGLHHFDISKLPPEGFSGWVPLSDEKGTTSGDKLGHLRFTAWLQKESPKKANIEARDKAFAKLTASEKNGKKSELKMFVGTWNVGNAPPMDDLSDWIRVRNQDLYVFGAQECVYKHREKFPSNEEDWVASLEKSLGSDYIRLNVKSFGEMRIVAFVNKDKRANISTIANATEATGLAHVHNNKGGVGLAFTYKDTKICLINAHLAAHQGEVKRRNSDVNEILCGGMTSGLVEKADRDLYGEFDHIIFMGDLNYRLDFPGQGEKKKPTEEQYNTMVKMIKEKKFPDLFQYDQLTKERKSGRVFATFTEGDYTAFEPTFKVVKGAVELSYNIERSPAWCDRVLWRSNTPDTIECKGTSSPSSPSSPSSLSSITVIIIIITAAPCPDIPHNRNSDNRHRPHHHHHFIRTMERAKSEFFRSQASRRQFECSGLRQALCCN